MPIKQTCLFVRCNCGNHGHRLKDQLGGLAIAKVFGFRFIPTRHGHYRFYGMTYPERQRSREKLWTSKVSLRGPAWSGMSLQLANRIFLPLKDTGTLIIASRGLRILPYQLINWYAQGVIERDLYTEITKEVSENFHGYNKKYRTTQSILSPRGVIKIAIHIDRGRNYDRVKHPQHFTSHNNVRYCFPISYFETTMETISRALGNRRHHFHIYTEQLNSEEIVERLQGRPNVIMHIGSNRQERNHDLIHDIFYHFVTSDILVACNSSFSATALYFRHNKFTIYHPHAHLNDLPSKFNLPTDELGRFDARPLRTLCKT